MEGLCEAYFLQFCYQVVVPHLSCLFLTVYIALEAEDVVFCVTTLYFKTFWYAHEKWFLNWNLKVGKDVVKLCHVLVVHCIQINSRRMDGHNATGA